MADKKISQLTELTAPAATDYVPVIDVSETDDANKNKRVTYNTLLTNIPEGSASTPSIRWIGDPDTGLAKSGDNGIMMVTAGTARLSIASDGKVTIANDLQVNGTTTTIESTTLTVKDKNIEIAKGNGNDAAVDGAGITIDSTDGDKTWNWVDSTDAWTSSEHINLASGKVLKINGTQVLDATAFTGNAATATALATARTIGGVSFDGSANINLPGVNAAGNQNTTGNAATATTATNATNVTLAAESTDTSCSILFATAATGNLPPKTATSLTFNSNTGALTATTFVGNLTGNVTGNTSGSSGSCTGNAATATALATAREINGVSFDGTAAISVTAAAATLTGNTLASGVTASSLTSVGTLGALSVTNAVTAGSLDISGDADIDGTMEADAYTVNGTALNEYIADTVGAMVSSNTETNITVSYEDSDNTLDFVIGTLNQNTTGTAGGLTGTPNITVGDVVAASLDISGNADIDGTLETDALTIDGTALNEYIADTVGAMVGSNTETGITVTYEDSDNTLDFVIGTLNQNTTGNAATATALATARAINGVDFDGTAAITVTAAAGTLTGTELKSTVVTSSLTSVGTLSSLATGAITTTDNLSVDNAKEVRLYEADSNGSAYVGIKSPDDKGSEASYTISLPAAAPTANQILKADSSTPTNLTWATDSGGIPTSGGTFTGKVTHNYTSSVRMAVGTTGQRDGSPSVGDFRYNTSNSEFEGYTSSGWGAIAGGSSGTDFRYLELRNAANDGAASYPGNDFTLVTAGTTNAISPTQANALIVSYAGIIQKPNSGTSTSGITGFIIDGSRLKTATNLAAAPDFIVYQLGAGIGTPSDATVTEAKLNANAPTNDYVLTADSSAGGGFKWAAAAGGGETGGGGEKIFLECEAEMNNSYTLSTNHNAGVFGPLSIAAGTITVPSGSVLTIV